MTNAASGHQIDVSSDYLSGLQQQVQVQNKRQFKPVSIIIMWPLWGRNQTFKNPLAKKIEKAHVKRIEKGSCQKDRKSSCQKDRTTTDARKIESFFQQIRSFFKLTRKLFLKVCQLFLKNSKSYKITLGALIQGRGTCSMFQSFPVISADVPCTYYVHKDL